MLTVNEQTFSEEVLKASVPTLVHFWAPWCGLCRLIVPTLLSLEQTWERQIKVVSVNADDNFKLANTYRLTNLPTLILFDRGQIIYRIEGFYKRDELSYTLENLMANLVVNSA